MGLLLSAIGGGLAGYGKGIENDWVAKRNEALETMRLKAQADRENANNDRADARQDKANDFQLGRDEAQHGFRMTENEQQGGIEMKKLGFQALKAKELAVVQSQLRTSEDAAGVKLREAYDAGDIKEFVRGEDGTYYGLTKKGKVIDSGIKAAPTAAEAGQTEGGRLTESEQEIAFNDAKRAWKEAGEKGVPPKQSDFIGMSRADYAARRGGARETLKAPANAPKVVAPADWASAKAEAGLRLSKKDPAFKKPDGSWMTADEALAMIRRNLEAKGYKVPND